MKKLVTIVSAVMMLLMLAACAPNSKIDADTMAAFDKAETAIGYLVEFAQADEDAETPYVDENTEGTWTNTAAADDTTTVDGVKIAKDSTATYSYTKAVSADKENGAKSISVNGTVTYKDAESNDVTVAVEYSYSVVLPYEEGADTSVSAGPLVIDDKAYDVYDFLAYTGTALMYN